MSTAIRVEDLSKLYRLGSIGTGTLSHDLNRWFAKMRGKEDPYLKLGQSNDRSKKGDSDFVWALKDISFDVKQGDVLGIIGKNGAGKSTLLKILSRTTGPTKGSFRAKGRIASLLEVGTGFHPELSGRENVFLNGAILGMTKTEIRAKFDEIVAFSGVERYIDTPVKRYSSGMYVRLAFAVAAHLEPEILVVDEVLAVGDAEFQEKCLGKMKDVSGEGRTVLFVSHNMPAVKSLCKTGLYLKFGEVLAHGPIEDVLTEYMSENRMVAETGEIPADFHRSVGTGEAFYRKVFTSNHEGQLVKEFEFGEPFKIQAEIELMKDFNDCTVSFTVSTSAGDSVLFIRDGAFGVQHSRKMEKGSTAIEVDLKTKLMPGNYTVSAGFYQSKTGYAIDWVENVYSFKVVRNGYKGGDDYTFTTVHGYIEPESKWNYK